MHTLFSVAPASVPALVVRARLHCTLVMAWVEPGTVSLVHSIEELGEGTEDSSPEKRAGTEAGATGREASARDLRCSALRIRVEIGVRE